MITALLLLALTITDAEAMAKYLWGKDGFIRISGKNFQIGCVYQGNRIIVSTSKISWDDAFQKVDLKINGPRTITAIARDETGNIGESAPVKVYLCNVK